jgi:hypothetical protein
MWGNFFSTRHQHNFYGNFLYLIKKTIRLETDKNLMIVKNRPAKFIYSQNSTICKYTKKIDEFL